MTGIFLNIWKKEVGGINLCTCLQFGPTISKSCSPFTYGEVGYKSDTTLSKICFFGDSEIHKKVYEELVMKTQSP